MYVSAATILYVFALCTLEIITMFLLMRASGKKEKLFIVLAVLILIALFAGVDEIGHHVPVRIGSGYVATENSSTFFMRYTTSFTSFFGNSGVTTQTVYTFTEFYFVRGNGIAKPMSFMADTATVNSMTIRLTRISTKVILPYNGSISKLIIDGETFVYETRFKCKFLVEQVSFAVMILMVFLVGSSILLISTRLNSHSL